MSNFSPLSSTSGRFVPSGPSPQAPSAPAPLNPALNFTPANRPVAVDKTYVAPSGAALTQFNFQATPTPYGTLDAHFKLTDKDGIDQKSKGDMSGQLDLDLQLSLDFLKSSLAQANTQIPDLKLALRPTAGGYRIDVSYPNRLVDLSLGSVTLKPEGDTLKVDLGGLGGAVVSGLNVISLGSLKSAMNTVVQNLSKDMGFQATLNSSTSYTLRPDLKNSPLFQEIPLAGGETLTLESVSTPRKNLVHMQVDAQGNLNLSMKELAVVASSDARGKAAVADAEGADQLEIQVDATLEKDMTAQIDSLLQLQVNIQPGEREALRQRLKNLMGQDLPLSGQLQLKNIAVSASLNAQGKPTAVNASAGSIEAKALQTQLPGGPALDFANVDGAFSLQQKGPQTQLTAEHLDLQGSVKSAQGQLTIDQLSFGGTLTHHQQRSQALSFALNPGQNLQLTGNLQQGQEQIKIKDLTLSQAQFDVDLGKGTLAMHGQGGQVAEAQIKRLTLPQATLYETRLKGDLSANLQTGALQVDAKAFGTAAKMGDVTVNWLQASGQISLDAQQGLQLKQARFSTTATLPELTLEKLSGRGDLQLKPNGDVLLHQVKNLQLETSLGLDVKGDFKGSIQGENYQLSTLRPAQIDYVDAAQGIDLPGMAFEGEARFNARTGQLDLQSAAGKWIEMDKGQINGLALKDLRLQGAFGFQGNTLTFAPRQQGAEGAEGLVQGSGQLGDLHLQHIESRGPVRYDLHQQKVSWSDPVRLALPEQGISELSTTGAMSLQTRPDGTLVFRSEQGTLSGKLGDLRLDNLQVKGEVTFDPRTQHIQFTGEEGMEIKGAFNGYDLDMKTSGQLTISQSAEAIRIQGEELQVNGLLEGFTLTSPEGIAGSIALKPDLSGFVTEDLQMGFAVDDMAVNGQGSIVSNAEGVKITLNGAVASNQASLQTLLNKLSQRQELAPDQQRSLAQVNDLLAQNFAQFEQANVTFEDLELQLDPQLQLKGFSVKGQGELQQVNTTLNLAGKKTTLPLGKVQWTAEVEGTAQQLEIPTGSFRFDLNAELRETLVDQVRQKLEDSGLKDVELSMSVDGKIHLENATLKHKKLSIRTELALSTRVVDNQLEVSIDKLKLKNVLFNAVAQVGGARERLSDEVDKMLTQQEVKFNRRNRRGQASDDSGHIFRLDLQALLKQVDPGLTLNAASLSPTGQVQLDYGFKQTF